MAGGDLGHIEGHEKFIVPDWRKYKIDGIRELEEVQKKLAQKGLKDPWLSDNIIEFQFNSSSCKKDYIFVNEVWRYQKGNYHGITKNALIAFGRGFKWAVAAMIITVVADKALGISASKKHNHGHH